jgi:NADH:ubiquinone oxidoreductase subunit E
VIGLSRDIQTRLAWALVVPAGVAAILCLAVLVVELVELRRTTPVDKQELETLLTQVKTDASVAEQLHDEYAHQAETSVERDAKTNLVAWGLLGAATVFLIGIKWLLALRPRPVPTLNTLVALRISAPAARPAAGHRRLRGSAGGANRDVDTRVVDGIVAQTGRTREAAIPILRAIQSHYGYLPDEALARVCELTDIEPAQVAGVSTFYASFRRSPVGEHIVKVCHGTACHVTGARQITEEVRRHLEIPFDADTDPERMFTVDRVACLGCCSLAPVMMIDDETAGRLTPATACAALNAQRQEQPV